MDRIARAFPPDVASPGAARAFVSETLDEWGLDPGDVVLVVGELASNAVRHAGTDFVLSLQRRDDVVAVKVSDANPEVPLARIPDADGVGGRGLVIVETLARAWGFHADTASGKVVWAEITSEASVQPRDTRADP